MSTPSSFFEYSCERCQGLVCERMLLLALAHDVEETLCVDCLVNQLDVPTEAFLTKTKRYIQSRSCFRKPWNAVEASRCPKKDEGLCPCQDEGSC